MMQILCMTIQQASKSKVSVKLVELDDVKDPPIKLYKPKEPYTTTIVSVGRIVGPKAPGEMYHIVIDHGENVPYWEGQSHGAIPPGENPKKQGAPHNVRLYSIASIRYGDGFNGKTTSLCVRRAVYYDPETGKEDSSKNGVCSNFLCNAKKGAFTVVVKTSVPLVPITLMGTENLTPAGKEGILNSDSVQVVIHKPMIEEKADELCRDVRSVNAETPILHGFGVHRMGYTILV